MNENVHRPERPSPPGTIQKTAVEIIQVNLGNRCNQRCDHCHVGASPVGNLNMDRNTARRVAEALCCAQVPQIEFTGGTPELNPNFPELLSLVSRAGKRVTVRTSLTVLDDPLQTDFLDLYCRWGVKLVVSLPCYLPEATDAQRGAGAHAKSIRQLRRLNAAGYGTGRYELHIVHNPAGDSLPPPEQALEEQYRKNLYDAHGVQFDRLITITNAPINRFRRMLESSGRLEGYMALLKARYNPATLGNLMCRRLLSVDHTGYVYDCDFNLALGIRARGVEGLRLWEIDLSGFRTEIIFADHCYACTAGAGSSCHGALADTGAGADRAA